MRLKTDMDSTKEGLPVPVSFFTFDRLSLQMQKEKLNSNSGKKKLPELSIFKTSRLITAEDKWRVKLQRYNKNTNNPIDSNIDSSPGPLAYSLISSWAIEKTEGEKKFAPNFLAKITNGVKINPYYCKIE